MLLVTTENSVDYLNMLIVTAVSRLVLAGRRVSVWAGPKSAFRDPAVSHVLIWGHLGQMTQND